MLNKKYLITAVCIYLAYFTHGIQSIVISQMRDQFITQWNTDLAGIMSVIAFTGLGKFVTVWMCGEISDRIGRKPMILIGAIGYVVFFASLLFTRNYTIACVSAFLAGASTSFFDGGSYPALQESFPKAPASALVLLKGFISVPGMLYPLLIAAVNGTTMWPIVIWMPFVLSIGVLVLTLIAPFSYDESLKEKKASGIAAAQKKEVIDPHVEAAKARFIKQPSFAIEGVCCLAYGFVCMMTFYLIQQCITIYGKDVIGMSDVASRALMTYYNLGALTAVLLGAAIMAKGVRVLNVLVIYTLGSLISMALMCFVQTPLVTSITSFTIGFFAAGGALQSGVALLGEYFPGKKGRNLGVYYTFMGLASYMGPFIAGKFISSATTGLEKGTAAYIAAEVIGKVNIMYFDLGVAAVGFGIMLILAARYKFIFGVSAFSRVKTANQ